MKKLNLYFHFWFLRWCLKISPNIYVHHPVVLSQVRGLDAAHGEDPSAVDEDVQPAEASHSLLYRLPHRLLIGEVAGDK